MQRRGLLKLGLVSGAALLLAGVPLAILQPGVHASRLSPSGREVFAAVGRALLEGTLPAAPEQREEAIRGLLDRVDGVVAVLPRHAQSELSQLLALLASAPGRRALAGVSRHWASASTTEIQSGLLSMRLSSLSLRRQAYQALHDIVGGAYFADPTSWPTLGYPGPVPV